MYIIYCNIFYNSSFGYIQETLIFIIIGSQVEIALSKSMKWKSLLLLSKYKRCFENVYKL